MAASCSSNGATDEVGPPISVEETIGGSAETTTTSSPSAQLDEAEVARLWEQTLAVFEASADDRAQVAAELPPNLPADEALALAELHFVVGDALELTSNAIFSPNANGSLEIVDCTDASAPSRLGPTTAGFTATAEFSPAGEPQITNLETVTACVQEGPGQAAIDAYHLFLQSNDEFWTDPRIDHPAIDQYSTERAVQAFRDYVQQLDELDVLDDTVVNTEGVERGIEIVGYLPGEIRIRVCQHGEETNGIFNAAGDRTDLAEPPWRSQITIRMLKVGGEWLFDEIITRSQGDCELGTTAFGLQLL